VILVLLGIAMILVAGGLLVNARRRPVGNPVAPIWNIILPTLLILGIAAIVIGYFAFLRS
jgi:hypothetical protein